MSLKILLQKQSINYSISNEKINTQALVINIPYRFDSSHTSNANKQTSALNRMLNKLACKLKHINVTSGEQPQTFTYDMEFM